MRFLVSMSLVLLLLTADSTATSSIELTHELTLRLNEVRGQIDTAIFVNLVGSKEPEIVLLDDSGVQIYSLVAHTLLVERPLTGTCRRLAIADMNGDGKRDVVALQPTELILMDNASDFAGIDTVSFHAASGAIFYRPQPPILTVLDMDNDGDQEMVLSYDSLQFTIWNFGDRLVGSMLVFEDFQTSRDARLRGPIRSALQISVPDGGLAILLDRRAMESADFQVMKWVWEDSYIDQWHGVDSTVTLHADGHPSDISCNAFHRPDYLRAERTMRTWGQLAGDSTTVEILSTLEHYQYCEYPSGDSDIVLHLESEYLSLHRFNSNQPLQEFWTKDITGEDWRASVYLPQFPGYFFAIVDSAFSQFRGGDGSLFQSSPTAPSGYLYWARPLADSLLRLIALDGNEIGLYRPDIVTAVGDDQPHALPGAFTLSDPYPNPFNPSVSFSITLPARTGLTLSVYNALGQEIEQIYRGELPAGEQTFVWDATDRPSGVYFIKASTEAGSQTKKAVLVK